MARRLGADFPPRLLFEGREELVPPQVTGAEPSDIYVQTGVETRGVPGSRHSLVDKTIAHDPDIFLCGTQDFHMILNLFLNLAIKL